MQDEEFTSENPWHEAVHVGLGLSCSRCRCFYQGQEQWRRDLLPGDHHRWCVLVADEAQARGWRRLGWDEFLCPKCAQRRQRTGE